MFNLIAAHLELEFIINNSLEGTFAGYAVTLSSLLKGKVLNFIP